MSVRSKANSNFHTASDRTVFDLKNDAAFRDYRRMWHENPEKFVVHRFPLHLDIESVALCNLRCPFCATTHQQWGEDERGYMDFDLYRKIIDEGAKNGLCAIKLSLRGEPLLHPKLPEMVAYAKSKGILDVYFNTNATLLTASKFEELIDAGLDRISISFEGYEKETYEKFRVGARFDKVLNNVSSLREIREKRKSDHPQIRVQTVLLDELKGNFPSYVDFWKRYADEVSYLDARAETGGSNGSDRPAEWACPFLWQRMTILWDGTILPCLMHGVKDFSPMVQGNAAKCSVADLWNGPREKELREHHSKGESHLVPSCCQCSYRAMETEKRGM